MYEIEIMDVPCLVKVLSYTPETPPRMTGTPDNWDAGDDGELELEIYKPSGRRYHWMEEKLSRTDGWWRVELDTINAIERERMR